MLSSKVHRSSYQENNNRVIKKEKSSFITKAKLNNSSFTKNLINYLSINQLKLDTNKKERSLTEKKFNLSLFQTLYDT